MDATSTQNGYAVLNLERRYQASVSRVFEAWCQDTLMQKWFGAASYPVTSITLDVRPGGRYEIVQEGPDGTPIRHFGTYIDVEKNRRLAFTWVLASQSCQGCAGHEATTLVTIEFTDEGTSTLLRLTHEKLPNQQAYDGHKHGWTTCLASLEATLA
ncbi:SRPBCC domain-containing protein [Parasalinivibrio latis]|uniref:SRPBCC family protein n=1 Tax=Parasalinivibrio latis TaxID=2952610 RepID=UPI0030DDE804